MRYVFTRIEERAIRELAGMAWERQLRAAIETLGQSIALMSSGKKDPFEVAEEIHQYHDGIARELYKMYSLSDPWFGVCDAFCEQLFTESELECLPEGLRTRLIQHADEVRQIREKAVSQANNESSG